MPARHTPSGSVIMGIMGQPKPLCPRLRGKGCALLKGAVPPLTGLVFLLRKGIGGIAYQQVCVMRRLQIIRAGGRIAGKYHAQPLARGAQHLRRLHRSALHGNALPFLQQLPLLHRHPQRPGLLRRDVVHRAQGLLGQGAVPPGGHPGDAEVGHLHTAVPEDHNVVGLDVPVDDPPAVGVAQRLDDLGDEVEGLPPVQLISLFLHILLQGDPVDQLHHDVLKVGGAAHVVHRHDIGVDSMATA